MFEVALFILTLILDAALLFTMVFYVLGKLYRTSLIDDHEIRL
jgi:hypothetical protein